MNNGVLAVSSAGNWWERSPNGSNTTNFCNVNNDGTANWNNASNANLLAPFGYITTGQISSESEIRLYDTGAGIPASNEVNMRAV